MQPEFEVTDNNPGQDLNQMAFDEEPMEPRQEVQTEEFVR